MTYTHARLLIYPLVLFGKLWKSAFHEPIHHRDNWTPPNKEFTSGPKSLKFATPEPKSLKTSAAFRTSVIPVFPAARPARPRPVTAGGATDCPCVAWEVQLEGTHTALSISAAFSTSEAKGLLCGRGTQGRVPGVFG